MRAKCCKERSEIVSTADELNAISSLCDLPMTIAEDILSGSSPWSFAESDMSTSHSENIPVRLKAQLVDKFMLVRRLDEEKGLLHSEMKNFLLFYLEGVLPKLREGKDKIKERIDNVDELNENYFRESESLVTDESRHWRV